MEEVQVAHGLAVGDHVDLVVVGNPLRWMMLSYDRRCAFQFWKVEGDKQREMEMGQKAGD